MKRKLLRSIGIFIPTLIIISCSSFNFTKLNSLQKGMSQQDVINLMDKDPDNEAGTKVPELDSIRLQFYKVPQYYYFVMAYKNDSLFYWGIPQDFKRAENLIYNAIGDSAVKIIKE